MDYRANLIGGRLQVLARPRRGVRVSCYFPAISLKAEKLTTPSR
jgi:hypothetical protein